MLPSSYVVFSGDIVAKYSYADDNQSMDTTVLEIILINADKKLYYTVDLPTEGVDGQVVVPCGVIDIAGEFAFRLVRVVKDEIIVLSESVVVCVWPAMSATLSKSRIKILSDDVSVNITAIDPVRCNSQLRTRESGYLVELEVRTADDDVDSVFRRESFRPVASHPVHSLRTFDGGHSIPFSCDAFDRPGIYRAVLKSSSESNAGVAPFIVRSSRLEVTRTDEYRLSRTSSSLFPCDNEGVFVYFARPKCAGADDKIRLYVESRSSYSAAVPPDLVCIKYSFGSSQMQFSY